jgi:sulfur relay (sulfurtransferase) DsrC/TusE family protein
MSTKVYAGTEVTVDDDGFFADPQQWREEMAPQIAQESGIDPKSPLSCRRDPSRASIRH